VRSGLVAAYAFSEGAGANVMDRSGHGHVGVVNNAVWTDNGRFGKALDFSGNGWVTVENASSLDLASGMTLEAWVYPTAELSHWANVIVKQQSWSGSAKSGTQYYLAAASRSGLPVAGVGVRDERTIYGKSKVAIRRWSHLAATYDGSYQRLYLNGTLIASRRVHAEKMPAGSGPLRIGGDSLSGQYFHGIIDEVRVYNRALSVGEINADMTTPLSPTR
jgi:hypothetical protein